MTNIFSRIGRWHSGGCKHYNRMRTQVVVFPIYANASVKGDKPTMIKAIPILVIRRPNHTKSPTDKIPLVAEEIMPNNPHSKFLSSLLNKGVAFTSPNYLLVIRPHSILKEDTAYLTVNLKNSSVSPNCNMVIMQKNSCREQPQVVEREVY